MKTKRTIAVAAGALAMVWAGSAFAQEMERPTYMTAPVRAPRNAFEIGVSTGYTQGFGNITENEEIPGAETRLRDLSGPGIGVGLDLAWRATPAFSLGVHGQYQELSVDDRPGADMDVRGMTSSLVGTFHLAPYQRVDPFVGIGAGYRMLWTEQAGAGNDVLSHGFQLAKVNLGFDMRLSDSVAIAPTIGADLNMFVWQNPEGSAGDERIEDMGLNTFIYAGVLGRFDLGGARDAELREVGRR